MLHVKRKGTQHGIQTVKSARREKRELKPKWLVWLAIMRSDLDSSRNRLPTAVLVNFDEEGFQTVTSKRKALGNLTKSPANAVAGRTRSGKVGRPPTSIKLADKERGQQMIQVSPPSTDCTRVQTTPEQIIESIVELVAGSAESNMDITPSSSL